MRELRSCGGCGGGRFSLAGSYAGELDDVAVEIRLWRCDGCGDETEILEPLDGALTGSGETPPRRPRVAA